MVALLAEGVDRNVTTPTPPYDRGESPSSRRAWIEMRISEALSELKNVALLAEGVDRNIPRHKARVLLEIVALLAEGVDRNSFCMRSSS